MNIVEIQMSEPVLLLTTWPDEESAEKEAQIWLNKNLVACVNILPKMKSLYRWKGEFQSGTEYQLLLKTTAHRVEALQEAILKAHPYECPEILHLPLTGGYVEYLNWIKGNTE